MPAPELCVVVLSQGEPTLERAVASLREQSEPADIVVAHSGPTEVEHRLPGTRVVTSRAPLTPGAARNAGIAATDAPFVAFLAADCRARPGWVEGRLRRHRAGAAAVASAMACPSGGGAALASHLLQHSTRMPHLDPAPELRFGVSYARGLLAEHGPFPEGQEGEEDVILNARLLAAAVPIAWAPEVLTEHLYPRSATGLLVDQLRRGRLRHANRGAPASARDTGGAGAGRRTGRAGPRAPRVRRAPASSPHAPRCVRPGALATAPGVLSERGEAGRSRRTSRRPLAAGAGAAALPPAPR